MKLLLDANISWRIIKLVENTFFNCLHANDIPVNQPQKILRFGNLQKQIISLF